MSRALDDWYLSEKDVEIIRQVEDPNNPRGKYRGPDLHFEPLSDVDVKKLCERAAKHIADIKAAVDALERVK